MKVTQRTELNQLIIPETNDIVFQVSNSRSLSQNTDTLIVGTLIVYTAHVTVRML